MRLHLKSIDWLIAKFNINLQAVCRLHAFLWYFCRLPKWYDDFCYWFFVIVAERQPPWKITWYHRVSRFLYYFWIWPKIEIVCSWNMVCTNRRRIGVIDFGYGEEPLVSESDSSSSVLGTKARSLGAFCISPEGPGLFRADV